MNRYSIAAALICALSLATAASAQVSRSKAVVGGPKIIIDTDLNVFDDDGQVLVMAAKANAERRIRLMGITLVTGNVWLNQERLFANKAVERLGIQNDVPVFAGANAPLVHSHETFPLEKALYRSGDEYWGAWSTPEPLQSQDLERPPDGLPRADHIRREHAADFIINTVRANPHEITILAIGPLTNLALAIRMAPDIVPLIDRIVLMAGAFEVPGNTTPAAEFNVWFDPEAARIVFREPIRRIVFPLDATEKVRAPKALFDGILRRADPGIQAIYPGSLIAKGFAESPETPTHIYDQLAFIYIVDPSIVAGSKSQLVDVDTIFGADYGRTLPYSPTPGNAIGLQPSLIVSSVDQTAFETRFVDELTEPIKRCRDHEKAAVGQSRSARHNARD